MSNKQVIVFNTHMIQKYLFLKLFTLDAERLFSEPGNELEDTPATMTYALASSPEAITTEAVRQATARPAVAVPSAVL